MKMIKKNHKDFPDNSNAVKEEVTATPKP